VAPTPTEPLYEGSKFRSFRDQKATVEVDANLSSRSCNYNGLPLPTPFLLAHKASYGTQFGLAPAARQQRLFDPNRLHDRIHEHQGWNCSLAAIGAERLEGFASLRKKT